MRVVGMLRIKNEARWIERCIGSILPLCDDVLVMDDHSTDDTAKLCRAMPKVQVFESPFEGLNEVRDKNWLLDKVEALNPEIVVAIDGDEILAAGHEESLREAMMGSCGCLSLRILYLWNNWNTVRVDGVYNDFHRESIFRPNGARFAPTSSGGNFHCGNVPIGNRANRSVLQIPLLHTGYMHQEDRIRKYEFYTTSDPGNMSEDFYRHMVVGDLFPKDSEFRYGGPLELRAVS